MPKLRMRAEVFSPQNVKVINYSGYHPSKTLKIIPSLIRSVFRITSTDFYEDEIKWDVSGDPIEFFGQWRGKDEKDDRTLVWIKVKVDGKQNSKDKMGTVTIYIEPFMITEFPYSNFLDKSLVKTYSYFYYGNIRRDYIEEELNLLKKFEDQLREQLGI
jgi:hypothetical protein